MERERQKRGREINNGERERERERERDGGASVFAEEKHTCSGTWASVRTPVCGLGQGPGRGQAECRPLPAPFLTPRLLWPALKATDRKRNENQNQPAESGPVRNTTAHAQSPS